VTNEQWLDAPGPLIKNLHYDTGGRQVWADSNYTGPNDALHDYQMTYDALSRVTHSQQSLGTSNASAVTLDQTPDANSNVSSQTARIAGTQDFTNAYGYDNFDHLTSVYQSLANGSVRGKKVIFGVNQIGQTTAITPMENATAKGGSGTEVPGTFRTYAYDRAGALTSINYTGGAAEYAIGRDAKHRVQTLKKDGGTTQHFSYFFDDELKTAPGQALDYDANFNRKWGGDTLTGGLGKDNRLTQDANYTYEYDREGNLLKRTEKALTQGGHNFIEFTYDFRNRLTVAAFFGLGGFTLTKTIAYDYDAADRMTRRFAGSNAVSPGETRFAYDDSDVIFTFAGSTIAPSTLTSRFLLGPNEHQVLAEDTPGQYTVNNSTLITRWYLPDYLGSTAKVVNDQGGLLSSLSYDAFGQLTSHTGPAPLVGFTGQRPDADTGLALMGKRWYDASNGRFTSEDPAGEGTNPRAYVRNNPLNYTDPTGMNAFDAHNGSGSGAGSGASQFTLSPQAGDYNGYGPDEDQLLAEYALLPTRPPTKP
jgi:RHS repeat-associated protein